MRVPFLCLVCLLVMLCFACDKSGPEPDQTSEPKTTEQKDKPKEPTAFDRPWMLESAKVSPQSDLLEILNKFVKSCKWTVEQRNVVPECKRLSTERLDGVMAKLGGNAMGTVLTLMSSDQPNSRMAATWVINHYLTNDALANVAYTPTADEMARLRELIKQSLPKVGVPMMRVYVVVQTLNKKAEDALGFADTIADDTIRAEGYRNAMVFGRLSTLPKIKKRVADAPDPVRRAALQAPLLMTDWQPAEQKAICPWAQKMLRHIDRRFRAWPPKLLRRCPSSYMDALLGSLSNVVEQKDYGDGVLGSYDYLCGPSSQTAMNRPQCERLREMLTTIVKQESTKDQPRMVAMGALIHQWPEPQTFKLASKILRRTPNTALGQHTKMLLRASKSKDAKKALKMLRKPKR